MDLGQSTRVGGAGLLALVATYGIGRLAYGLFVPGFSEEFELSLDVLGYYASAAQAGYLLTTIAAGTSAGGAWAPFSDAVASQVPPSSAGRALALVNAGSPVGLLAASALLLVSGHQWRIVWWAFAAIGLVAASVAWRVLEPGASAAREDLGRPGVSWFFNARSAPLLTVAIGISISAGAYFSYAPETAEEAGLADWIGPAMWATLGIVGAAVGAAGGRIADRYGLRRPLAAMLVLLSASFVVLLMAPGAAPAALASAGLFGVGFTTGFALLVIWSQQVFHDRPTTGFTLAIVFVAAGFIVGPSLFGVLATGFSRPVALLVAAVPALLVALVPPARRDRRVPSRS